MGAVAAKKDFTVQAGATWTEGPLTYKVNGTPVDLTSWSARMQVRATTGSPDIILNLTDTAVSPDPRLILGGVLGTIGIQVEAVDTSTLNDDQADVVLVYGLEIFKNVGGVEQVIPLLQGNLTIKPEVVH